MPFIRPAQHLFRGVLFRAILFPLLLMLVVAGVFVWQIGRLIANTEFVEQVDRSIAQLNRLEKLHIDLETGLRGYLLTSDSEFLAPYRSANDRLPAEYDALLTRVGREEETRATLESSRERLRTWLAYAERQLRAKEAGDLSWQTALANGEGKRLMDLIRLSLDRLIERQEEDRTRQNLRVQQSAQTIVLTACGLALLVGLALAMSSRGQLRWLSKTYENALVKAHEASATLERRVEERTADVTRSNAQLGEANRELEAFAYSVSHDLRAPMRHITGFSKLTLSGARDRLTTDDVENLETIYSTALLAGRMVDDLLAFSRVGRTSMRQDPVDMNAIVRRAIEDYASETKDRQIEWNVDFLPPAIGDASLLKLVWLNLIGNAIKYSAKASPARIEIGVASDAVPPDDQASSGELGPAYFIRDNGVGFDMAYAHKLFGVFQRLHRAEDFEGTGIGLANVRRIIVRHNGQVWADGRLDEGATFWFRLPAKPIGKADQDSRESN